MTDTSASFGTDSPSRRFQFGQNWLAYVRFLDESGIAEATRSFTELVNTSSLDGKRFIDVGCGSGLSSLIACRLGAEVLSIDCDEQSVAATLALKTRYAAGDDRWKIERGSVLDRRYLEGLGTWDVVYSWGVLHHTGSMWTALDLVSQRVASGGFLVIAIYNDQGFASRVWRLVKRMYVHVPILRPFLLALCAPVLWGPSLARATVEGKIADWWSQYQSERGMSRWHDLVDWVGGYPFEVATSERIIRFCEARGFLLERLVATQRLGCNQFRFRKCR